MDELSSDERDGGSEYDTDVGYLSRKFCKFSLCKFLTFSCRPRVQMHSLNSICTYAQLS